MMIFTLSMSRNDTHVLRPVEEECRARGLGCRSVAVSGGDYSRLGEDLRALQKGDVLVCANHGFLYELWRNGITAGPGTGIRTVWTMHEFVSSKLSMLRHLHWVDYACVPNDYVVSLLESRFHSRKMFRVGYVQLDTLYHAIPAFSPHQRYRVLVCPTGNFAINGGMGWLAETADVQLLDVELDLKHHEMFKHDQRYLEEQYGGRLEEPRCPWIRRVDPDADLCQLLPSYDAVVADVGSAMFIAAMTKKPVLVYDSYEWWREPENFDSEDAAFRLRDRFYSFSNGYELVMLLEYLVHHGDPLKEKRLSMVRELSRVDQMNVFDGCVAARIVNRVEALQ